MGDPERIYLQPGCCATPDVGRLWCEDDEPVECEEGRPWTEYVRADLAGSPEVERSVAVRVAIRDADMIERVLGVLEGHGTVSLTEIRTAIGAVERIRRALATPSESGTPDRPGRESDQGEQQREATRRADHA